MEKWKSSSEAEEACRFLYVESHSSCDLFVNSFELTIFELWWTRKSLPNDVNVSTICREAVRTFWSKWFFTVVSIGVNRNFHLENGPWFNCDWYIVDFLKVCCWCLLINLRFYCCSSYTSILKCDTYESNRIDTLWSIILSL